MPRDWTDAMKLPRMHWAWRGALAVLMACAVLLPVNYILKRTLRLKVLADPVYQICTEVTYMAVPVVAYGVLTRACGPGRRCDRETRCRRCGYILRGLVEPRCPECGERI